MINKDIEAVCCQEELALCLYKDALKKFGNVVNDLVKCTEEDCHRVESMAWHVIEVLNMERDGDAALSLLNNVRWKDTDTFIHSVNVAMLCYDIAKWSGFDKHRREEAALCGLLHDVGKLTVPDNVLKKPGLLTDEERDEIKKHTSQGFLTLLFFKNENVRLAALQHHERYDGSGYPCGLVAEEVNEYAQIVSIADVYDALTSDRVYRKAFSPGDALSMMEQEQQKYAPVYFRVFLKKASEILKKHCLLDNTQ